MLRLPPLYDHASIVLAWPEIGFPETVVELSLPDRATVERNAVSIWDAPLSAQRAPRSLTHRIGPFPFAEVAVEFEDVAIEAGRIVATPRVLSRSGHAAVVLTRVTAVGAALSIEILSVANGEQAHAVDEAASSQALYIPDDPAHMRRRGPGASIAVVHDDDAVWVGSNQGSWSGGNGSFRCIEEFAIGGPDGGVLGLQVAWPAAGLPDVCVAVPLNGP